MATGQPYECVNDKEFGSYEVFKSINLDATGKRMCTLCEFDGKKQVAAFFCAKCGHKYFCEDCIIIHAGNNLTKDHQVESSKPKVKREVHNCEKHNNEDVDKYCHQCQKVMCNICNLLEHKEKKDHRIEQMSDYITTRVQALRKRLDDKKLAFQQLMIEEVKLSKLDGYVEMVQKRDLLFQQVEEYGAKVVSELKAEVSKRYQVLEDIDACRDRYKKSETEANIPVLNVERVLAAPVHDEAYVVALKALENKINDIDVAEVSDTGVYSRKLQEVVQKRYEFSPEENLPLGLIISLEFKPTMVSQQKARNDVNYIAIIPDKYIVLANYNRADVDVYDVLIGHIRTIKCKGTGVRGLAATPEGRIAVLLSLDKVRSTIEVYDAESTSLFSTYKALTPFYGPQDMAINSRGEFFIATVGALVPEITVMDNKGQMLCSCRTDITSGPIRLACADTFIFVTGDERVNIFEMNEKGLKISKTITTAIFPMDICGTIQGDFFVIGSKDYKVYLGRYQHWDEKWNEEVVEIGIANIHPPRIATSDSRHIYCAQGNIVKLYKA